MIRFFIIMLILVNAAALSWCGFNYVTLSSVSTQGAINKINRMSELANKSLSTMESYSAEHKQRNVNKIISQYKSLTEHNNATKDMTIEVTDVLFQYIYIFFALSALNVLSFFFILFRNWDYFAY